MKISALLTKTLQIKNSYQHYNTLLLLLLAALGYLRGETVATSREDASAAMKRGESRRGEEKREAAYFARAFPVFLGSHCAPARSPSPPSFARSPCSHRPKPNQTSGHWAIAPQPPQDGRRTDEADEADVPYFGCGKLLREDSEVE